MACFARYHSGEAGQRARKRDLKSEKTQGFLENPTVFPETQKTQGFLEKRTLTTASVGSERGKNNKKPTGEKGTPLPLNVQYSGISNGEGHSFQLCRIFLERGII